MAESNDRQKRVTITLEYVATEDTDYDYGSAFYVAGGAATGPRSGSKRKALLTYPVTLDDVGRDTAGSGRFEGGDCIIFDDNVYVDDFVEFGLQFRTYTTDFGDEDKLRSLASTLTAHIETAVESLPSVANGAVAGAILAATSPALAIRPTLGEGDTIFGTVQKRVNVADWPDGDNEYMWTLADQSWKHDKERGEFASRQWTYHITYKVDVQPVLT
ncbi:hypothetical protein [Nonomuraea sp. NPDC003709]|uniref:hypothetical protein n=1 Tax=Nonomuraea sp. NPDC003709 TaxID=3154450 RepID=UPI0033A88601